MKLWLAGLAVAAAPALVGAQPGEAASFYVFGGVGHTEMDVNRGNMDDALRAEGRTGLDSSADDTDTAYKVGIGYRVTRHWAVEASYIDFGEVGYDAETDQGDWSASTEADGYGAAIVGSYPIFDRLALFGKLGAYRIELEGKVNDGGRKNSVTGADWEPMLGVGLDVAVTEHAFLRGEYEHYRDAGEKGSTGETDIDYVGVSLGYRF